MTFSLDQFRLDGKVAYVSMLNTEQAQRLVSR